MNLEGDTSGSAQIADQTNQMQAIRQEFLQKRLLSPGNGGSISLKITMDDLYGARVEALMMQVAATDDLLTARLSVLRGLSQLESIQEADRQRELNASRLHTNSPIPDEIALMHASLPAHAVILVTHPAILAFGCTTSWQEEVQAMFGKNVVAFEYSALNPDVYRAISKVSENSATSGLYLRYYGLLVWADTLGAARQSALGLMEKIPNVTSASAPPRLEPLPSQPALRVSIAQRRLEISRALGKPYLLRLPGAIPANLSSTALFARGVPSANHLQSLDLPVDLPDSEPALGMTVHATSAVELNYQTELLLSDLEIRAEAERHGTLELLQKTASMPGEHGHRTYNGEVALITGAATGIGRAAVKSLLDRGAAVIGVDIKPEINDIFDDPAYLGLQCDLTDESAAINCLEKTVRSFGGLDMLVLNAGIFPSSCALEAMSMEYWRQVMQINLDVNITLLREAYPMLKRAPRYGRVVINGSRNVPAPGPGAAAYSASKAALNQLGRVAALEWASSGIRVNMLNPHAVFDTGIWTDEVLKSRAAKYGLTVEQYKTNNLLHVELTSRDLGELIAETLGPLFSKTTGAQIPVDGGSDRVI